MPDDAVFSTDGFKSLREMQNVDMVKVDKDTKRHPGEIDSIFHWAGKTHILM